VRREWLFLVLALVGCDASTGEPAAAAPAASLHPLDPSLVIPSELPEPSYEEKRRAEKEATLSSTTLAELLDQLQGRFGDEQVSGASGYSGMIVGGQPPGRDLLEEWAAKHMRFSDVAEGQPPTVIVVPASPGSLVCVESKDFHIPSDKGSPRTVWLQLIEPNGGLAKGAPASGFTLRAFGDVPPPPSYAGRFCGVYTGILVDLNLRSGILVGMFDTAANREK
jgi:hypothetical protein